MYETRGRNIVCSECLHEEPIPIFDWEPNRGHLTRWEKFFANFSEKHKDCVRDWSDHYISERGVKVIDKRFRDVPNR